VLQVRRSRDGFPVSPGIFLVASDSSMCPGVDSASKNEYLDNSGGKGGRCVRLTTYHLHVLIVKKSGGLNLLEPCRPVQACNGTALPLRTQGGPGSVVDIATAYRLDGLGLKSRWGRDFPHLSRPALRPTQPPVQWAPGLSQQ
jgi:hypothetical protein